jgi:hypothetical protein
VIQRNSAHVRGEAITPIKPRKLSAQTTFPKQNRPFPIWFLHRHSPETKRRPFLESQVHLAFESRHCGLPRFADLAPFSVGR